MTDTVLLDIEGPRATITLNDPAKHNRLDPAGLSLLRQAIEKCPEDLWYSTEQVNAVWQTAYHTLFFAHLYCWLRSVTPVATLSRRSRQQVYLYLR